MTTLIRILVALAFVISLALPGIGGDGPENGGGTGVWVLPLGTCLTPPGGAAPRAIKTIGTAQDFVMQMSPEVGTATGTFVDNVSAVPVALPVSGSQVRIPAALLQSLVGLTNPTATIVIADDAQVGYVIYVTVFANGTATLRVL